VKAKVDPTVIRHTIKRVAPLRKLFSKEQRKFYDAHAPESLSVDLFGEQETKTRRALEFFAARLRRP
jgi:hypothetical protein